MSVVLKVYHLLSVLMERLLGGAERLILGNHIVHRSDVHPQLAVEVHLQFQIRAEDVYVVILVVLVTLCGVTVYQILEHYAVFNSIVHTANVYLFVLRCKGTVFYPHGRFRNYPETFTNYATFTNFAYNAMGIAALIALPAIAVIIIWSYFSI
jgi:hypothetical protein